MGFELYQCDPSDQMTTVQPCKHNLTHDKSSACFKGHCIPTGFPRRNSDLPPQPVMMSLISLCASWPASDAPFATYGLDGLFQR